MNELLSPLYFVFKHASSEVIDLDESIFPMELWKDDVSSDSFLTHPVTSVEADVFFVFTQIMSRQRDNFIETLDHDSKHGIRSKMLEISHIISRFDPPVHAHLNSLSIDPQFYALRWISVLLAQDFSLTETIRIWDSLFSCIDTRRCFVLYFCASMVLSLKKDLLQADFATVLSLLQHYSIDDLEEVVTKARKMYLRDEQLVSKKERKKDKKSCE
ncbi:hypothetical protein GEMRC1_002524 [Eukaryota sp. GEM-RC1]